MSPLAVFPWSFAVWLGRRMTQAHIHSTLPFILITSVECVTVMEELDNYRSQCKVSYGDHRICREAVGSLWERVGFGSIL